MPGLHPPHGQQGDYHQISPCAEPHTGHNVHTRSTQCGEASPLSRSYCHNIVLPIISRPVFSPNFYVQGCLANLSSSLSYLRAMLDYFIVECALYQWSISLLSGYHGFGLTLHSNPGIENSWNHGHHLPFCWFVPGGKINYTTQPAGQPNQCRNSILEKVKNLNNELWFTGTK